MFNKFHLSSQSLPQRCSISRTNDEWVAYPYRTSDSSSLLSFHLSLLPTY